MKIATWNVNSIRVRLPQVLEWLHREAPDILCLQETKITDEEFPVAAFRDAGYQAVYAGQKTYNGVATLSRRTAEKIVTSLPGADGAQKRLLAATIGKVRVINVYVPNGEEVGSEKYSYKLSWLAALGKYLARELKAHPKLALLGDYNIAPDERDVHDPKRWAGHVLFSDRERAAFQELAKLGLVDVFRKFDQPEKSFSWWDYRAGAFHRNHGLRIDHILCSAKLTAECRECRIDIEPRKHERPSDHAPVFAEFHAAP
ncbi:MAG: exodeoxyribonuclease III [Gammaproteobacteria bacterium]|nr:exodeoxyribonuclease III [Gammaproteobacteria bacterium]